MFKYFVIYPLVFMKDLKLICKMNFFCEIRYTFVKEICSSKEDCSRLVN